MPKTMKKAQQINTIFPIGLRDVINVSTTSFSPGALLMTLMTKTHTKKCIFGVATMFELNAKPLN